VNDPVDIAEYCRAVETYLCRRNGGHLIRIAGPAFEQVCGWASRGVPLNVVFRGIDQYCDRNQAKASRRRPVRIEFCEADILDLFDAWRRAVGVTAGSEPGAEPSRRQGLATHIDRAIGRLTALRAGGQRSPAFVEAIDASVRGLDVLKGEAQHARGERRAAVIAKLEELDARLSAVAKAEIARGVAESLRREAAEEIRPFAERMTPDAREGAIESAYVRLVRESLGIPTLRL
jgi:hypothetical protein